MFIEISKIFKAFSVAALVVTIFSCAPSRLVKPVEKNSKAVGASIGGPLFHFAGTVIPMPLSSVSGAYGLKEDLSVFAGIHTTTMAFGVLQTDIGVIKELIPQKGFQPAVSVSPAANVALSGQDFKLWPQLDLNIYWNYKQKKNFFYAGVSNWFELSKSKAHEEKQTDHWIINPHAGHTFSRTKMDYTIEVKYLAPGKNRVPNAVEYVGFGRQGAIGLYFGLSKKFSK